MALLCSFAPLNAAVFFVDGAHPGGDGSLAHPFQTISSAARVAGPGDMVLVGPGVYRESVRLRKSGAPDAPIKFIAAKFGSVILTGADPIDHLERIDGDAPIYRIAWPHVFAIDHQNGKAIEFHPENAPLYGRAEEVIADDQLLLP